MAKVQLDKFQEMVVNDLKKLGKTADQVAESLVKAKVKGNKLNGNGCPLANWFVKSYKVDTVSVAVGDIEVNGVSLSTPAIPKAIDKFIDRFDDGHYPNLEEVQKYD